jgi:hypothetical protein
LIEGGPDVCGSAASNRVDKPDHKEGEEPLRRNREGSVRAILFGFSTLNVFDRSEPPDGIDCINSAREGKRKMNNFETAAC